jgi:L-aspartate oxidase
VAVAGAPLPQPSTPLPSPASRAALWRHAGLERDGEGLGELTSDPHPLVRLIAYSALVRTETRGAHRRRDHPELDPALDGVHATVRRDGRPALERWA